MEIEKEKKKIYLLIYYSTFSLYLDIFGQLFQRKKTI